MLHYVALQVTDLERSGSFYDAVLAPLGWRRQVEDPGMIGWGLIKASLVISRDGDAQQEGRGILRARGHGDQQQQGEGEAARHRWSAAWRAKRWRRKSAGVPPTRRIHMAWIWSSESPWRGPCRGS